MNNSQVPAARKEGLVIQEAAEEILVYDLKTNKAHCLNQTAAVIWRSCDGTNSVEDIIRNFEKVTGQTVQEDFVWLAIDQLSGKDLLEKSVRTRFAGQNRREVIKKIGLATVIAMPIVASLTAPRSAMATVSCACTSPGDCLTQTACPSTSNCNAGVCAP